MNRSKSWLLAAAAALCATAVTAATITVLVQETTLRKRPQFYAPSAGAAKLGESFDATGPSNGWYQTGRGYIHSSAVTAKKVNLGSGASVGGTASAEEVTLAGKGFNSQVEKSYAEKNKAVDFAPVDAMERRSVTEDAVLAFLRAGGLLPGGAQ